MKVTTSTVFDTLQRLRLYFQKDNTIRNSDNEEPFRSELYSTDIMDRHGEVVARSHKLQKSNTHTHDQLLKRLDDNERTLLEVRNLLVESIRLGKIVTPAAEWLLDNFYLIEEQVIIARKHLPKGYSEGLPCLIDCISEGLPRVYDTVLEIISHSDGRVDEKNISSFIAAYQQYTVLTLGELWAIPIMLRLAVIENLRRVSRKIALDMIDQNLADNWADRMTTTLKEEPGNLILIIADMARSKPVLAGPFVAGLTRKLQGKGPSLALALSWMEQQLSGTGVTSSDLVQQENQKQAADQVSVRNCIGTLRFLGAMDWRVFVEKLSSVEQVLRKDGTGTYPLMDFATRDRYRHVVESISKASPTSETEVAQIALELAEKHKESNEKFRRKEHIGYYLIDKGLKQTEQKAGMRYPLKQKLLLFARRIPVFLYLLSITLLTLIVSTWMCYHAYRYGTANWLLLSFVELLALSASTRLAVPLVNWFSTIWVHPKLLPRMDFSTGIPAEFRTLVVVPTMLSNKAYIEELVEGLEIRFLANKEVNLHFGLLTDFIDSNTEIMPEDDSLLELAKLRIEALNQKYKQSEQDTFFLFHRPRIWNSREQKWMGYERKRGKLSALNALLREKSQNEFSLIIGNYQVLTQVKYVITLDSDTQLPRETAWKFIATMAHPLNQAIYNQQKKRVTEGYGILQPRVSSSIPTTANSLYLQLQGNTSGIDPYSRASSDVYQDLFAEGSFIGKGIYDVDIFEKAVHHVFQENRILSHDLLEGCYTRSGLLSNVLVYEQNPVQYRTDVNRHYRWVRGDWQIGAWMLPFVTNSNGSLVKNKLSTLSRWKIFDNLRRSLIPQSLVLLLIIGWSELPLPWFWTSMFTAILLLPLLLPECWHLVSKPDDLSLKAHLSEVGISVRDILIRFLFDVAVMPYEAYKYTDAVIRTNWRMVISRKKLLEWTPSATTSTYTGNNAWPAYRSMWINPMFVFICILLCARTSPDALSAAAPILVLWLLAPAIAWRLSIPKTEKKHGLPEERLLFLHQSACKTWSFFEQFVTAAENWLPPDNFQELPVAVIAHRTSPTNIGLALLANLTAYDFGYITANELAIKCNNTLQTLLKLERYKGHFYNWYDTRSLLPLRPRYVSTVDSGNLTGHLLTLRQGLLAQPNELIFSDRIYKGLRTTALIIRDLSKEHSGEIIKKILISLKETPTERNALSKIKKRLDELTLLSNELTVQQASSEADLYKWTNKLSQQIKYILDDLTLLVPWLELLPIPKHFVHLETIDQVPSLMHLQAMTELFFQHIDYYQQQENTPEENEWLVKLRSFLTKGSNLATARISLFRQLAEQCEQLSAVEYDFLFNKSTNLLSIGYNVEEQRKDDSYYDLLASEARLGIFVAIAQGKLPQESWFALGRLLTNSGGDPILLSWSGSMFEYLMPQLVMPSYKSTLLYQTNKAVVKRQIDYAGQRGIPWGISESAYNTVDANLNYQYRAFGIPGLGLKRGLEEDLVIAPYASMLALMVSPEKACMNLQILSTDGFEGEFGFFEAVDYTASRLPRGKEHSVIQSYMVHHQGMSLLSLAYVLLDKPMQRRFELELRFQATLLLLQERIPRATLFYAHTADTIETHLEDINIHVQRVTAANTVIPEIQLLSNGRYQVMITNSGGGYSRWKDIAVTRWREDTTKDNWGIFCYIKDINSGKFWSNTYHPTLHSVKEYEAIFSQGHVEFSRLDYGIDTKTEIVISPEDDIEMRRIRITNKTLSTKTLEITSYAEIVMASQASDEAHPAFSNLFVQTEIKPEHKAIFCTRRSRTEKEVPPWMFHLMDVHGTAVVETVSYETDRMQFIGRGKTLAHPQAMEDNLLSGSQGSVLDPIMAIRYRIIVRPNHPVTIDLIYGISETKEACESLMHKYQDQHLKKRAFELFWTYSQILLRQINATEADAQLYNRLASSIIYANPDLRAEAAVIQSNYRGQSGLWSHSVSGDLPIVLLHIYDPENMELVRQLLQAHAYWRLKGLAVDLIIWNEDHGSYRQLLQEQIQGLIAAEAGTTPVYNKPGNIFVKSADQISSEDRILFESIARVIISDNKGSLSEQVNRHHIEKILPPLLEPEPSIAQRIQRTMTLPDNLQFFNGIGGFTPDGKEYKILTDKKETTPAPWVNVMANPNFGTIMSESGSAYTWAVNAHEYRITPWSNDPVSDIGGEAYYLRDEETGHFWSPSPFPAKGITPYIITHGFGYTLFEHIEQGVFTEMCVFVDKALPVKFIVLKIKNRSGRERKFSATGYLEIILGDTRTKTNMHILSEHDTENEALLFRNRYNSAFADRVTFFKVDGPNLSFTADRSEFIGRNRTLEDPQALYRKKLSGRVGAGMDPCAALQIKFDLLDGAEKEILFQIGNEENSVAANTLMQKFTDNETVAGSLTTVKEFWKEALEAVQVTTPNDSLNILANGWLTYQTMACRLFARSGFYQSGGAFGFRDQLQDVLALLHTRPSLAREQILLSASRQFAEGDVQHWWHPPEGRGVRTHCSDDMLWLPFAVSNYIVTTGDTGILTVPIGFLESRALFQEEESLFDLPISGNLNGILYEHCARAIRHSLHFGKHGLPLMGSGDWNDGMDQVGNKGQGESVWLAFFLYDILLRFATIAKGYGDMVFAETCTVEATALQLNIEASAWDGQWYLRAWFDDGTPLGSKENEECRIDAIAQSWSVLSGAADGKRRNIAMASLNQYLVKRDMKLIQLLDPPFDGHGHNPGYIQGYVPGVRENGGQYSHAAIWALMAFAAIGDREKVWELFSMIHPLSHSSNAAAMQVYKVEPYVMAADIYANESHRGRGGWTWYTGSSGWMYQFIIGSLIGMKLQTNELKFTPCFPLDWPSVSIVYRFGKANYRITLFQLNSKTDSWFKMDGTQGIGSVIKLVDDGLEHEVEVHVCVTE
jgi:cyclic beta-1,2-glucan synthetase